MKGGLFNGLLGNKTWTDVGFILAFIAAGPFVALAAGLRAKNWPGLVSTMFVLGGLISGGLAIVIIRSDNQALPLLIVPAFMVLIGLFLRKSIFRKQSAVQ